MAYKGGAHIIVLGNEKGGSGKSTTAMHIMVSLMKAGARVGAVDLDSRQRSLSRYVENRVRWCEAKGVTLEIPDAVVVSKSKRDSVEAAQAEERESLAAVLDELAGQNDFVIIDCPGTDSLLSRMGHAVADTLVTPINDSFVDFDLLARVDPETFEIIEPSLYAELVWESRKRRAIHDRGKIDWVVMRNRLQALDAKNKRRIGAAAEKLADRIGFRLAPGFGERVIYRELFLSGLTLMDLRGRGQDGELTMSHVAARAEVRGLIMALQLPGFADQPRARAG